MGRFTFISYEGDDSGEVLIRMTSEDSGPEVHEIETHTQQRQFLGFTPNEETEEELEPDDEPEDSKRRSISG